MMKLQRMRVADFRSVSNSDWIELDTVTALIGTNESGKSNLLLPLWKLNPAKDGHIELTADLPRKHYTEYRTRTSEIGFIHAEFAIDAVFADELATMTGEPAERLQVVVVTRFFDGTYKFAFPSVPSSRAVETVDVRTLLTNAIQDIQAAEALEAEAGLKTESLSALSDSTNALPLTEWMYADEFAVINSILENVVLADAADVSTIAPRMLRVRRDMEAFADRLARPLPSEMSGVAEAILRSMPRFVYYSNYGNLDSEIYLPHVIANLTRADLGARETAKARTLKVLFEFVGLSPQEILELGRDFRSESSGRAPTQEELDVIAGKKKQRSILLQSASAKLTERFRSWWKQGDYRFRFEADGDHFRIWVSDDKRPEDIELEGRSTGLQWFLSFYLVFLVESADAHSGATLLLDEPGMSLHPLAQRDLSIFFDGLAESNQLLYTTHSPFLVDADRLERVRKVYVGHDGTTRVTSDLRVGENDAVQRSAGYAVHAALSLTVSESLLLGCEPVIVEGPSDQHYLSGIRRLLLNAGLLDAKEIVFAPAGGVKGVKPVAGMLMGRDDVLPMVLVDSDAAGAAFAASLKGTLYSADAARVLQVGEFVALPGAEIEDLLPAALLTAAVDRIFRNSESPFLDVYKPGSAIVPQIESWLKHENIVPHLGWKVDVARRVKQQMLAPGRPQATKSDLQTWQQLFSRLLGTAPATL
jgi:energy-coupling factor transporter ATP-binding protein EcfA2